MISNTLVFTLALFVGYEGYTFLSVALVIVYLAAKEAL